MARMTRYADATGNRLLPKAAVDSFEAYRALISRLNDWNRERDEVAWFVDMVNERLDIDWWAMELMEDARLDARLTRVKG